MWLLFEGGYELMAASITLHSSPILIAADKGISTGDKAKSRPGSIYSLEIDEKYS